MRFISRSRLSQKSVRYAMSLGGVLALGLAAGCSDVVTYSRESRETGLVYYNGNDYGNAAGAFKNAIRQNPADYQSHYYLASCYEHDKAYHQAIQQYRTCLGVMTHSLEGKTDRPFRLMALDGLASAIAKSEDRSAETTALTQNGNSTAEDYFVLAKVNRYAGDADGAIEAYTKAALLDPHDFAIAKELGLYLEQLGQNQSADPQLRRAYTMKSDDDQVNAALRRIGVVPGPGLKAEKDLAKPLIPEGPIPTVDVTKVRLQNPFKTDGDSATSNAESGPRD